MGKRMLAYRSGGERSTYSLFALPQSRTISHAVQDSIEAIALLPGLQGVQSLDREYVS